MTDTLPKTADVVVVGGGVMGCAAARALAKHEMSVVVLERAIPGAEASSAAAGILGAQAEADAPGPFAALLLRSRALYEEFARALEDETGLSVGYEKCGALLVAFEEKSARHLSERYGWQRGQDPATELLSGEGLKELFPGVSSKVRAGLYFPSDAQVEPPLLARALAKAAQEAGAVFVRTAVRRILHDEREARGVETEAGAISAPRVVVAAGAWTCGVRGSAVAEGAVFPVRGQMVELDGPPGALSPVVIEHGRGYIVPRPDGRIVCGSTSERAGFEKKVTAAGLQKIFGTLCDLAPALGDAQFLRCWANFRPGTSDKLPLLGEGPVKGIFFASGHFRNGILLTPVTAEILGAIVPGAASPVDLAPYDPARFQGKRV